VSFRSSEVLNRPAGSKSVSTPGLIAAPPVSLSLSSSDMLISSVGWVMVMPLRMFMKPVVLKPVGAVAMVLVKGLCETGGKAAILGLSEVLCRLGACLLL